MLTAVTEIHNFLALTSNLRKQLYRSLTDQQDGHALGADCTTGSPLQLVRFLLISPLNG